MTLGNVAQGLCVQALLENKGAFPLSLPAPWGYVITMPI